MEKLPQSIKEKSILLRSKGYSLQEISKTTGIAKATASLWLRDIILGEKAKQRLANRISAGRYRATLIKKEKRIREEKTHEKTALKIIEGINRDVNHNKLYCALLYWCEGGKSSNEGVRFINSDPFLVRTFLDLFRKAYNINERKLRVLMHLHSYHNEEEQKEFWSKVTNIPENQFNKTFQKINTGKRVKKDYAGCVAISYHNSTLAREIKAIYKVFSGERGTW